MVTVPSSPSVAPSSAAQQATAMKMSMAHATRMPCILFAKQVTSSASASAKPMVMTGCVKNTLSIAYPSYPDR